MSAVESCESDGECWFHNRLIRVVSMQEESQSGWSLTFRAG